MLFPVECQLDVAVLEGHTRRASRRVYDDRGLVSPAPGAGFFVPGSDHVEDLIAGQTQIPLGLGELGIEFQPANDEFSPSALGVNEMAAGPAFLGGPGQ